MGISRCSLTAQDLIEAALSRGGSSDAVIDGPRLLTYQELAARSARLANGLPALGAGPKRPVAALVGNRLEYVEVDVAAIRAGVPRVGLSDRLSPDEWRYILMDSQAAVLVVAYEYVEQLGELPDTVVSVLVVDSGDGGGSRAEGDARARCYEAVLADASPQFTPVTVDPCGPGFIMYTSGTTGRPKGAWHSHAARAAGCLNMLAFELRAGRRSAMVHVGPLTHGSGAKLLPFLVAGGRSIVLDRFEPEALARAVSEQGGTHTFVVPTMIHRLCDEVPDRIAAIRGLEQISFGGSPIAPSVFRTALDRFGPILVQVYGSTEAPHPITLLGPDAYEDDRTDALLMSAGHVSPSVGVRVVDDAGAEVAAGGVGELEVRAPHLMSGYWNNPTATRDAFTSDGWYVSGDLASVDDHGLVTFRDRKKDLIITGGLNVYPSEVERVLLDHPQVKQAVVVGYPDEEWGESVLAYIVAGDGGEPSADELTAWTKERLAGYKKPRRYELRTELPTGSSHKVLRNELRDELWRGRARGVN